MARQRGEPESVSHAVPADSAKGGETYAQTMRVLADAGRLDHPAAASALVAARVIDDASDTASSLAAMMRQHMDLIDKALDGARIANDPLDELADRRARRRA